MCVTQRANPHYERPSVRDHGSLEEWTGSTSFHIGTQVLSVAAALSAPGGGVKGVSGSGFSGTATTGVMSGGGVKGATGGGSSPVGAVLDTTRSSGGGSLPFTGLVLTLTASVGAALASLGAWLRYATRRGDAEPSDSPR